MNWKRFHKLSSNRVIKGLYIVATYMCAVLPDRTYLNMMFRIRTGQKLHLDKPETFNEKIQWLKMYQKDKNMSVMVDKYSAREYVAERIGEDHLIPIIGVYDRFEDINFDLLPKQFVVKCTHDSGSVVICDSKKDLIDSKEKLTRALKRKYYFASRDYTYKGIKPRLIIEYKLENDPAKGLIDYKFYCFNGEPKYLYISEGLREHATAMISFYNMDFTLAPFKRSDYKPLDYNPEKPVKYDEMVEIARTLSNGLPFVRVDLYEVGGKVYFSELTFAPCGGYMPFEPKSYDLELGELLHLPM